MLLLGIDIGTSSVKVSVVDAETRKTIGTVQYPETESPIISETPGWAEQSPETWWHDVKMAILRLNAEKKYNPFDISAIGIAYQMHGLVMVDKDQQVLRHSILWCDSRAVKTGEDAFEKIGKEKCLQQLLNSPGNFTASKLSWVKQNEPHIYAKTNKIMLPGDFIAMKLTGNISTTISALSEGIFWDFKEDELSPDVFNYYGLDKAMIPEINDVFSVHGTLNASVATSLSLKKGIPVSYKSGDQPNNALSLNVLEPGEVAATAGTSGVIYGITDQLQYDKHSRVNSFAHVNYTKKQKRLGVLLCINGTGILNSWVKNITGNAVNYQQMNEAAASIAPGSEGLTFLPFGNGAERMLNNKIIHAAINGIDLNKHKQAHLFRAAQEGVAFAFRYGFDIMRENGMDPRLIRAGKANLFLSDVFVSTLVNTLNIPVELYPADGSAGAAIGAGIGAGIYTGSKQAFEIFNTPRLVEPTAMDRYEELYQHWLVQLQKKLN